MKHQILGQIPLDQGKKSFRIMLIPENESERLAIDNVHNHEASEQEFSLVNDYLTFCLGNNYSVYDSSKMSKGVYSLKAQSNSHSGFGR
ncbi:hypothetical protein [Rufibacter hautae]|uniref:Uncharacterized protein n=1 Tax=Rufibacter hautae TaxID=2595005 RepID=A0A5B6T6X5_9BACT|nr:hypothetical protein [Rufibacter hautae]KAA3435988.1 hypothetical protein FOA19_22835 [Rufibacter hautae]